MRNSQELAIAIKKRAKEKNISVGHLLERCELSKNALSSMQAGGYMPRLDAIIRIADCLEVSIDDLLERTVTVEFSNQVFSDDEMKLISAYRAHPEMHEAVHRILGIEEAVPGFRLVAYGGDNVDNDTPTEPRIT